MEIAKKDELNNKHINNLYSLVDGLNKQLLHVSMTKHIPQTPKIVREPLIRRRKVIIKEQPDEDEPRSDSDESPKITVEKDLDTELSEELQELQENNEDDEEENNDGVKAMELKKN